MVLAGGPDFPVPSLVARRCRQGLDHTVELVCNAHQCSSPVSGPPYTVLTRFTSSVSEAARQGSCGRIEPIRAVLLELDAHEGQRQCGEPGERPYLHQEPSILV